MNNIEKLITLEDIQKIKETVTRAEETTTGEIVPMIVSRSSVSGHVSAIVGLLFLTLATFIGFILILTEQTQLTVTFSVIAVLVLGFAIAYWAPRVNWFLRFYTSDEDLSAQVERRAELEFWRAGLHKTDGSTGILIFVSLAEHQAVVLADDSISKKLPPETWEGVVERLLAGIKKRDIGQGFTDAIDLCGRILSAHFPAQNQNKNELPNRLIIKD